MPLIHSNATKDGTEFLRVWIYSIWLLIVLFRFEPIDFSFFSSLSYSAVGLLRVIPPESIEALTTVPLLTMFKIVLICSLMLVIFNIGLKFNGILAAVLLTIHQSFIRSYGYLNHPEIALLCATYAMSVFFLMKDEPQENGQNVYSFPFISILLILCLTYSLIATRRFIWGGWDLFMSDSMVMNVLRNSNEPSSFAWNLHEVFIDSPTLQMLFKWGFPVTTLVELLAPFSLISRGFRKLFLCVMIPFHVLSWVFLSVFFWQNLLLYILFNDKISRFSMASIREKITFKQLRTV